MRAALGSPASPGQGLRGGGMGPDGRARWPAGTERTAALARVPPGVRGPPPRRTARIGAEKTNDCFAALSIITTSNNKLFRGYSQTQIIPSHSTCHRQWISPNAWIQNTPVRNVTYVIFRALTSFWQKHTLIWPLVNEGSALWCIVFKETNSLFYQRCISGKFLFFCDTGKDYK